MILHLNIIVQLVTDRRSDGQTDECTDKPPH